MPPSRRALGAFGESLAAHHLEQHGYRILARNVRAGGVELDLVVARAGTVAFVEVKTRRHGGQGSPVLAVDVRKQARIARGAAAWLRESRVRYRRMRFDVVACVPDATRPEGWRVEHWPGAFDAP